MAPVFFMIFLSWSCCLADDPNLDALGLYQDTLRFGTLTQESRNREVLRGLSWNRASGKFQQQTLQGWPVCDTCFRNSRGISKKTWERRQTEAKANKVHWEHASQGSGGRSFTEAGLRTRAWMNTFFTTLGDYQPDSGQIHLPPMDQKVAHILTSNIIRAYAIMHVGCVRGMQKGP